MEEKIMRDFIEDEIYDSMSESKLSPSDFITLMFERTDEDGILYIPGWHYSRPGWTVNAPGSTEECNSYRCKMDWNLAKYEKLKNKFEKIYNAIEQISKFYDDIANNPEDVAEILKDDYLTEVWSTYLAELPDGDFDLEKCEEIYDKLDTIAEVKHIAEMIAKGKKIESFQMELLAEYVDVAVTPDEVKYRQSYLKHLHKQAEIRLGDNICAYDVLLRAWRLCRLMSLNAPGIIVRMEGRTFAAAFILHECGISREIVDNTIRLRLEQMELMSEEELDELYRPQKVNTRKSLAPLFVYEILTQKSDSQNHLRQNDILKTLERYPYEISLERKALSRILHNLIDSPHYAVYQDKTGVWVDRERIV